MPDRVAVAACYVPETRAAVKMLGRETTRSHPHSQDREQGGRLEARYGSRRQNASNGLSARSPAPHRIAAGLPLARGRPGRQRHTPAIANCLQSPHRTIPFLARLAAGANARRHRSLRISRHTSGMALSLCLLRHCQPRSGAAVESTTRQISDRDRTSSAGRFRNAIRRDDRSLRFVDCVQVLPHQRYA